MPFGSDSFSKHKVATEQRRAEAQAQFGPKADFFGLQSGQIAVVRFLEQGTEIAWAPIHRVPVEGRQYGQEYVCLDDKDDGTPCPFCLHEDELVWTERGLIPIGDMIVGDVVMGIDGSPDVVVDVSEKVDAVVEVKMAARRDGIRMTADHLCFVVPSDVAQQAIRGMYPSNNSP